MTETGRADDNNMVQLEATYERPILDPETNRLKMKGGGKIFHANSNHKRAEEGIVILNKIDFKMEVVISWHFMLIRKL